MVVFIDYDDDVLDTHHMSGPSHTLLHSYIEPKKPGLSKPLPVGAGEPHRSADVSADDDRSADPLHNIPSLPKEQQNPNRNAFSAALSCYPIIKEIARSVDLNTLHALSRTCRQFHANLAPYRQQLIKQTLRCENEYIETLSDMLDSGASIPNSVKSVLRLLSQNARSSGRMTSGKVAKCARDMVAECRRCSKVVCRNCIIKPPSSNMLKHRIRRLCTTCRTAPLRELIEPPYEHTHPPNAYTSPSTHPPRSIISAFQRTPCSCNDAIWLCHQCGHQVRSNDTTYRRVWTWRTRYSTYLGGLGTGIGEGCQGVKCGRGEDCLAAQEIELEVECEADEASGSPPDYSRYYEHRHSQSPPRHFNHTNDGWDHREEEEPGYFRQEIIGIGGRVKQKAKKRVTVGACVVEHEDERETGEYLIREERGQHRSWCGWCWRVIPAKDEL
ncbi:hypothetical protein BO78DRAFT_434373 [Aspergillus sclerotiicarbonarius CBS 121057]|uniref:F-box domain-containing protein n=1 Tax=Aspergillus sclerotiicarbonarius (strain CBS 121057 / IBT 28362) TaxID=1448318 RepID=A0A319F5L0_ASPSB|nr:hypothetical protein BO78DRAFT_434373 [Aspergillus sclerotiicarbonarius CBS 121057]